MNEHATLQASIVMGLQGAGVSGLGKAAERCYPERRERVIGLKEKMKELHWMS